MRALAFAWVIAFGCLDPQVGDEVDPSRVFGDPNLALVQLPHVQDNPELMQAALQFPVEVPYARGFADGRMIYYWRVPQPTNDFIVPLYIIRDRDGAPIDRPIIDVLPGDTGYSPWWRVVSLTVTDRWQGEHIWSREAIDLALRNGLLEEPIVGETVVTCAVVDRDVRVQVAPDGRTVEPTVAIYRNQLVSWIEFRSDITVSKDQRAMPIAPFYVFQRIDQPYPLSELDIGFDLDGDGRINASNNIFEFDIDSFGYTPAWYPILVRTVPDFVSIDTATTTDQIEFTDEEEFVGPVYNVVTSDRVIPPLVERRDQVENCPIQRELGSL